MFQVASGVTSPSSSGDEVASTVAGQLRLRMRVTSKLTKDFRCKPDRGTGSRIPDVRNPVSPAVFPRTAISEIFEDSEVSAEPLDKDSYLEVSHFNDFPMIFQ